MTQAEFADENVAQNDPSESAPRNHGGATRGNGQAGLLLICGFGCALFGLALSVGPLFSWKANQIMIGVGFLGVHGGTMFIGGLVLAGLGMLRRGQHAIAASTDESTGDTELVEEMATDVVQMRHAVDHLQMVTSQMQEQVRSLAEWCEAQAEQPRAATGDSQGEAVFRLAASLDKVGAKIEERMKSQFATLRERLDSVEAGFEQARDSLEARVAGLDDREQVQQAEPVVHAEPAPTPEPVVVEQAPPAPESPLGVLDTIEPDDVVAPLPEVAPDAEFTGELKLSDVNQAQGAAGADSPGQAGTQAGAHGGTWGGPLSMAGEENAQSAEERQRMLAETRLRQSLQNMQRDPSKDTPGFGG